MNYQVCFLCLSGMILTELALGPLWSSSWDVRILYLVCPLPMQFFPRPLIGPRITWSDSGLLLVHQNSVSMIRTLKRSITCNRMMVSLMRTLKRSITCTITCNLMMVSLMRTLKKVHYLNHNLKSPDDLLDENSEEVHNLQSPNEKMCSWRQSELCLLDENWSLICNLLMKDTGKK